MEPQAEEALLLDSPNFQLRTTANGLVVVPPEGLYECALCGEVFNEEAHFEFHRKSMHESQPDAGAIQHEVIHQEVVTDETKVLMYACERCPNAFPDELTYQKHQQTDHSSEPCYVMSAAVSTSSDKLSSCSVCSYSTSNSQDLLIHEQRHNQEASQEQVCEQCGEWFESEAALREHNCCKLFTCDKCPATYRYRQGLRLHAKTHQPGYVEPEKKYPCSICNKRFVRRQVMLVHMRTHGDSSVPPNEHKCTICDKVVSSKTYLTVHMRKHTGEKPFKCDICNAGYISQNYLSVHRRTHTGEKPHYCMHCGKAFTQRTTMVVHERRHTGVKPYGCDQCPKAFASKTMLNSHLKTHAKQSARAAKEREAQLQLQQQQEQSVLLTPPQEELVTTTTMFAPQQMVVVESEPIIESMMQSQDSVSDADSRNGVSVKVE